MVTEPAPAGYLQPSYARSLAEFGQPMLLPLSGGWLIGRPIPSTGDRDAMGSYPLFCCMDWARLAEDLACLAHGLVAVSLVTDPFGAFDPATLARSFPDVCRPFKEHFVVDLETPFLDRLSPHHARNLRRSRRAVEVETCEEPWRHLEEWSRLYSTLIERHDIRGVAAFSRPSFEAQLRVPGITMFRASENASTVGMLLWYAQGDVAYYHLGAYSPRGYELRASYALFAAALQHFQELTTVRHASLGAGAGVAGSANDGLTRFKQGWATATRATYFCGRIFDRSRYDQLTLLSGTGGTTFFPAYRAGEFGDSGAGRAHI